MNLARSKCRWRRGFCLVKAAAAVSSSWRECWCEDARVRGRHHGDCPRGMLSPCSCSFVHTSPLKKRIPIFLAHTVVATRIEQKDRRCCAQESKRTSFGNVSCPEHFLVLALQTNQCFLIPRFAHRCDDCDVYSWHQSDERKTQKNGNRAGYSSYLWCTFLRMGRWKLSLPESDMYFFAKLEELDRCLQNPLSRLDTSIKSVWKVCEAGVVTLQGLFIRLQQRTFLLSQPSLPRSEPGLIPTENFHAAFPFPEVMHLQHILM